MVSKIGNRKELEEIFLKEGRDRVKKRSNKKCKKKGRPGVMEREV